MKNKTFSYLLIVLFSMSCKAQQYPLNTNYRIIPDNAYLKDINNEYGKFVGNWKAILGNKEIDLSISKEENRSMTLFNKNFHKDVLLLRYKVLVNNQIVENTINYSNNSVNTISMGTQIDGSAIFDYKGLKCLVGNGFITLEYVDSTHLKWNYQPQSSILTNKNCPDYAAGGIKINLPDEPADIIFTKQ